jgi:hypothetical protein
VKQFFKIRERKRAAGNFVNHAGQVAPFISLSITMGKVTRRYEEVRPAPLAANVTCERTLGGV